MATTAREKFKTRHAVFDEFTNRNLFKLISQGYLDGMIGPVSIGKESNVFQAKRGDEKVIVKIHRLETSDFNKLYDYLRYDPRYTAIKKQRRLLIFAWCQREFRNLMNAREAHVAVPKPIAFKDNILIEEFIGDEIPASKLKDEIPRHPGQFFDKIIDNMRKLYKAGFVHTDLSAFNILNHNESPVLIDFSQCTTLENQNAMDYLRRDVKNVCIFLRKL